MINKIKVKFSMFLAVLLLLTVLLLSLLVLNGIKENQRTQYEEYLAQQAQTANIYLLQSLLTEENKQPESFLTLKGESFIEKLELISGLSVMLYDHDGVKIGIKKQRPETNEMKQTLNIALNNKTAYLTENESLYYLAPLRIGKEQVGVVQFNYSLSEYMDFYKEIQKLFIYLGAAVCILSFILAFFYFGSFANAIIKLEKTVNLIRKGHYETTVLSRKDEIGKLSQGIYAMSKKIEKTLHDMDAEKDKLTLAVEKLSALDEQKKQFISNITHEFKTPLTSIKAYLDLLEMYPNDQSLWATAKVNIKSETEKLYDMVVAVLQLSSMDKYDFEYKLESVRIDQVIQGVLHSLQGKLDKFGVNLEVHLTDSLVEVDKESLLIILVNILDNAIKYNKAGGSIKIKNYVKDAQVFVDVTDTGVGVPEELAQQIFEPYYTVDKNRSREHGGFGLGLALAKKHAEILGGSITLIDTSQTGTTFRIAFPSADS